MIKFKQSDKPLLTKQEQWEKTNHRIKLAGWVSFILSLFSFLVAIWTIGDNSGRIGGTAVIFLVIAASQAMWFVIRND